MCKVCFRLTAVDEVRENAVNTLGRLLRAVIDDQTHVLQTFLARKAGVDQVADMLTKPLAETQFLTLRSRLLADCNPEIVPSDIKFKSFDKVLKHSGSRANW